MKKILGIPVLWLTAILLISTVTAAVTYTVQASSSVVYPPGGTGYGDMVIGQNKLSSSISCFIPFSELPIGSAISVSGIILPTPSLSDGEATLTYTQPDDTVLNRTVLIEVGGSYDDFYYPGVVGEWHVAASWIGDASYEGAISATQTFTVTAASNGIPWEFTALVLVCGAIILIIYKRTH